MVIVSHDNYKETKDSEEVNYKSRVVYLQEEKETLLKEMETMRLKSERDRTKLRFYKGEYTGFEVARKTFEEDRDRLYREVAKKDKDINSMKD